MKLMTRDRPLSRYRATLGMPGPTTRGATNGMNFSDRTGLYRSLLPTFLSRAKERGYIVIGVLGRVDEYVQFVVHDDRVVGEVGSRQWKEPERPLPPAAVAALGRLGFVGGGRSATSPGMGCPARPPSSPTPCCAPRTTSTRTSRHGA
jgi:hypothetical protein